MSNCTERGGVILAVAEDEIARLAPQPPAVRTQHAVPKERPHRRRHRLVIGQEAEARAQIGAAEFVRHQLLHSGGLAREPIPPHGISRASAQHVPQDQQIQPASEQAAVADAGGVEFLRQRFVPGEAVACLEHAGQGLPVFGDSVVILVQGQALFDAGRHLLGDGRRLKAVAVVGQRRRLHAARQLRQRRRRFTRRLVRRLVRIAGAGRLRLGIGGKSQHRHFFRIDEGNGRRGVFREGDGRRFRRVGGGDRHFRRGRIGLRHEEFRRVGVAPAALLGLAQVFQERGRLHARDEIVRVLVAGAGGRGRLLPDRLQHGAGQQQIRAGIGSGPAEGRFVRLLDGDGDAVRVGIGGGQRDHGGVGRFALAFCLQADDEGGDFEDIVFGQVLRRLHGAVVQEGAVEGAEILDAADAVFEEDDRVAAAHRRRRQNDVALVGPAQIHRLPFEKGVGSGAFLGFDDEKRHEYVLRG